MLEPTFTLEQSLVDFVFKLDGVLKNILLDSLMFNSFISGLAKLQVASLIPDLNLTSMEIDM